MRKSRSSRSATSPPAPLHQRGRQASACAAAKAEIGTTASGESTALLRKSAKLRKLRRHPGSVRRGAAAGSKRSAAKRAANHRPTAAPFQASSSSAVFGMAGTIGWAKQRHKRERYGRPLSHSWEREGSGAKRR